MPDETIFTNNPSSGQSEAFGQNITNLTGRIEKSEKQTEKDMSKINSLMTGVVIFVVITFTIQLWLIVINLIKDKDLYFEYNNLYQGYSDKNYELKNKIDALEIEINNMNNKINILKSENYLK